MQGCTILSLLLKGRLENLILKQISCSAKSNADKKSNYITVINLPLGNQPSKTWGEQKFCVINSVFSKQLHISVQKSLYHTVIIFQ